MSHKQYIDSLHRPSAADARRISDIQVYKESEVDSKYHAYKDHEHHAAGRIQKAYRGHRDRRQLEGLTLDPSARWAEAIKEMRYRSATVSSDLGSSEARAISPSDHARQNWRRIGQIAEHAAAGERSPPRDPSGGLPDAVEGSMLMDLRYFLEMVDDSHRYGTNLQVYHEAWLRSQTTMNFFTWLDHGEGKHLSLAGCDRARLDRERIRYLGKEEREDYLVQVDLQGMLRWEKNGELITTSAELYKDSIHGIVNQDSVEPAFACELDSEGCGDIGSDCDLTAVEEAAVEEASANIQVTKDRAPRRHFRVSPATILNRLLRATIRPGTWIYVVDTVGRLYVGIKSSGAFQHASFLSGARILSAGSIGIDDGRLVYLSPLSGHYRPTTKSFRVFIDSLKQQGVDLSRLRVSKAYQLLLGIEYYGKTKAGLGKVTHRRKRSGSGLNSPPKVDIHAICATATDEVERNWQDAHEDKHGLAKLMDDLHIRRRSVEDSQVKR
ncbi:hypothetical protein LTR36_001370 [Oleoguttula mirabilis]|uniref:IQ calmodulin-binding motif protein n=1 Tax=Oleoguttula mirabilis TaxID=1507867 RepID=A0AAV9JP44_9PEZI|nr:hypothetical protein LTR36_001370 [Oleoguttula mirabilis]